MANTDVLVIHVDADIANEPDLIRLHLTERALSVRETCDCIRAHLSSLLGGGPMPAGVVLCVPAQCTEAWVFVALYPEESLRYEPIEGRVEVERLLIGKRERLVRDKGGAAKKQPRNYSKVLGSITARWQTVVSRCMEAERFGHELGDALTHRQARATH